LAELAAEVGVAGLDEPVGAGEDVEGVAHRLALVVGDVDGGPIFVLRVWRAPGPAGGGAGPPAGGARGGRGGRPGGLAGLAGWAGGTGGGGGGGSGSMSGTIDASVGNAARP